MFRIARRDGSATVSAGAGAAGMFAAIGRGFRRVFDVSGRDSLRQFWPYAFCVLGLTMVLGAAVYLPTLHSDVARGHPGLMPDVGPAIRRVGLVWALAVLFLAAAVAR